MVLKWKGLIDCFKLERVDTIDNDKNSFLDLQKLGVKMVKSPVQKKLPTTDRVSNQKCYDISIKWKRN